MDLTSYDEQIEKIKKNAAEEVKKLQIKKREKLIKYEETAHRTIVEKLSFGKWSELYELLKLKPEAKIQVIIDDEEFI